ncbi:tRna (guanine-N1)-methyltransferase [Cardiosporidium cionae]|uniref:tRNA (guanine(9)-N(1))-methyltransferase n=1 Tax=Cardiosporidium cionae TaxID=476202 RepID=A0ABQ7JBB0_9APIC|nr:tRna (guanine-N1)-methyltransferase [Cardiosporidium cionae]|eukprot:KAF8821276.1 tRna (guanine-N1)-methyltransferase [Cardiosporidium cionae]
MADPLYTEIAKGDQKAPEQLSHSQKKALKRERYLLYRRQQRPKKRRERRSRQRCERQAFLENLSDEERRCYVLENAQKKIEMQKQAQEHLEMAYHSGQPICINCSFGDTMMEKEIKSLAKQIFYSYHYMKNHRVSLQFHLTSFPLSGVLYEECIKYQYAHWKVHTYEDPFWELFDPKSIIILSPDAEEALQDFDPSKVYVIGGLVDCSVITHESYMQAKNLGLPCRKLPIQETRMACMNSILNINTIVEILVHYKKYSNWNHAFENCVPKRKQQNMGRRGIKRQQKRALVANEFLKGSLAPERLDEGKTSTHSDKMAFELSACLEGLSHLFLHEDRIPPINTPH